MMDMLVPRPGEIVDWYGKEEIIFFGPDEGTAPYMEDAAKYAKERGYGCVSVLACCSEPFGPDQWV